MKDLSKNVFVLSMLLCASVAHGEEAEDPSAALEQGRSLIRSFEYRGAVEQLEVVVSHEGATAAQRCEALELLGSAHFNRRRQAQARSAFERLLELDPGYQLTDPDIPPRVVRFFEQLSDAAESAGSTTVEAQAPDEVPREGVVAIEALAGGDTLGIERSVANVRTAVDEPYRTVEMTREGLEFSAEVDVPDITTGLEYYVELQAPSGHVLARAGTAEAPLQVAPGTLPPPEPAPVVVEAEEPSGTEWYRSWWFWTIVGAVVVGGVTATVVLTLPEEEHQDGTWGSVQMPIEGWGPEARGRR